jgi:hypothetical protein
MERNRLISVRKLAAIDIVLHGPRLVLLEYSVGMGLSAVLGLLFIYRGLGPVPFHSLLIVIIGFCLIGIGLNYFPLLVYAIQIVRQKKAKQMVVLELANPALSQKMYGKQSMVFIFIPMALFLLAISQEATRLRSRSR